MDHFSATVIVYSRRDGTADVSVKVWRRPAPWIGQRPTWSRVVKVVTPARAREREGLATILKQVIEAL